MRDAPEMASLLQYSQVYLWLAVSCLVFSTGWLFVIFWLTRRKPIPAVEIVSSPQASTDILPLKDLYVKRIEDVGASYTRGEISSKNLYQQLSSLLRHFSIDAGHPALASRTLAELKYASKPGLEQAIELFYTPEFSTKSHDDIAAAIHTGKRVVAEWH